MSRKKSKRAVPDEVLAEGSGPVEAVAEEAKKPSKKKFSKKKAPKAKKAAAAEVDVADEPGDVDELESDADELRVDGASPDADVLRADGDDSPEPDAEELRAIDDDMLRADDSGAGAEMDADELRADGDDVRVDGVSHDADGLRAGDISEPDADELRLDGESPSANDADQLRADGDGAGDDAPVIEGDDVVGAPITDEAGVEAALLPGALSAVQLRHLIEALIFATDKPVTLQRLRQLTRVSDVARIESALAELQEDYKERGIALQQVSGGYQFRTNTAFSSWVQQLIAGRPVRLSRAQLETLAIVAYRQPITRPEIDEIRGVDSSNTLRLLLERSLIRVLGKREEVGRPTLYGTTKEFLDFFSLGDLRELPTLREYSELTAESRQVMSDRLGVPLDANGELEPEVSDEIDPEQLEPDSASIVDSILAEHAAAEAEAEARFDARDASAIAEAAMSGGSSFDHVSEDDDAMSLSGGEMSTLGSRLPASEARSYVDAIRASVVESDELSAAEELMSESREPHMADAATSAKSNFDDELLEAHVGLDDSESMSAASGNPHVETGESMANVGHDDSESMTAAGETTSAKSNIDDESLEAHVGHDDSEAMAAASSNPHVETDESMADAGHDDSEAMAAGETTSAKSNIDDESLEAHAGHDDSESMADSEAMAAASSNPHVETYEAMANVGHDDSEAMAAGETTSAKSNIDDESLEAHAGHDDSESMTAASSNPHVETDETMSASDAHLGHADSESTPAETGADHDSPSTGDSMVVSPSDEPQAGHADPQVGHDVNSTDSDLDAEPHVGHNAPVTREPDNDPESSGN